MAIAMVMAVDVAALILIQVNNDSSNGKIIFCRCGLFAGLIAALVAYQDC
jgi:hypothetical protein